MSAAENIRSRFHKNLKRTHHLLEVFRTLHRGGERASELHADVVRAAVVFMHATLEDLLRSTEELRLPLAPASAFERIGLMLPGADRAKERLTLVELAQLRGQTVNEVLLRAFQKHHEQSNYNNEQDVVGALQRMALEIRPFESYFSDLAAMMKRRHLIAHRADRNPRFPRLTNVMKIKDAERWVATVETFGEQLLSSL
ncbi:hypothetical protein [Nannocystis punicea]|uniref:RiboL-PSP-HEPN domain-containing protein n=1 Tax=Nannocystis punicea TaxID=2995304 RepID=A0ABY7H7U0_9BACT|nr:hypothetical protein [Nannocystis poenicansa]WAS95150.1 hypothetical protein O0S08_03225 [Nannocystis poenicansa]